MIRRVGFVLAAVLAVLFGTVTPAHADTDFAVAVASVTPGQVRLIAAVPDASGTQLPEVAVLTRDGLQLSATVQRGQSDLPVTPQLRTVVVVLDTSSAMGAAGLAAAQDGLVALAKAVPADVAIGVVAAGAKSAVVLSPTRDVTTLRTELGKLHPAGGTALYAGLRTAAALGAGVNDRLLVVSSGREPADDPGSVVSDLAGRRVDLVSLGAAPSASSALQKLTAAAGTVRTAGSAGLLSGVLSSVAATFPPLMTITVTVPPELAGATDTLTVTTGAGAARASRPLQVKFSAASLPRVAGSTTVSRMPEHPIQLLALFVFGGLLFAILVAGSGLGTSMRRRRLKQIEQFRLVPGGSRGSGATFGQRAEGAFARAVAALSSQAKGGPGAQEPARQQDRPGATAATPRWAVPLVAGAAGAVLFGLLGGLLGVLFGALLGGFGAAWLYPRFLEQRRRRAFADHLPDALQLVVGSLRSGFSLAQAIDAVVQDSTPGPLTVELGRAMGEVRLGAELDDALERAAQRAGNDDLAWAVMAIRIQRETGGNLAEIIETTVETLRERDRLRRHVRALSAEGRLSAYILIALPFVITGWLFLVRREYISELWTTGTGLMMLAGAAILMVIGILWMMRWMKVEV